MPCTASGTNQIMSAHLEIMRILPELGSRITQQDDGSTPNCMIYFLNCKSSSHTFWGNGSMSKMLHKREDTQYPCKAWHLPGACWEGGLRKMLGACWPASAADMASSWFNGRPRLNSNRFHTFPKYVRHIHVLFVSLGPALPLVFLGLAYFT